MNKNRIKELEKLNTTLEGELHYDKLMRILYATDASAYRELPLAVAYPKTHNDLVKLIRFANSNSTSLIPRTAGTSLAGQCVGNGIVVDVSKHFTKILSLNEKLQTVTVQPGVVRDELNNYLKPYGLFFGPNTSTSNRCMIGGMVGNNSSGSSSIKYGVTRDKLIKLKTLLSDGSEAVFESISIENFRKKQQLKTLEGSIYKTIYNELSPLEVQGRIKQAFPKPEIHRRNTGYAIDELILTEPFTPSGNTFNLCKLLAGSEGTLAFSTEITLQLDKIPPQERVVIALHFSSIEACLRSVEHVMTHNLYTCEMIDDTILDCTKHNIQQQKNRFFIEGDPKAILLCELRAETTDDLECQVNLLIKTIDSINLSYAHPRLEGEVIVRAEELRKAGLGLLGNLVSTKKAVACIEDTAVAITDLANYIADFTVLMRRHGQEAVYYAHAGAGELHLRPLLNLKKNEDVVLFRTITSEVMQLVKKYKGSMSGEHGDGRVRSEFISQLIGEANYNLLKRIKTAFDPHNIFNPHKIVNALPMDTFLRYSQKEEPNITTMLDFPSSLGILSEAEKCNGSGDCRKLSAFGGVMCPSYRATKNEKDTTRARANALREFLTHSTKTNKFNHKELKAVFDLCLSCKACVSECPSSVDVASLKAEFLYQYQKANGIAFRDWAFAYNHLLIKAARKVPFIFNSLFKTKILHRVLGIAIQRDLPKAPSLLLSVKLKKAILKKQQTKTIKNVYLFLDEFTSYLDPQIGVDTILLLKKLNYGVFIVDNHYSGRSFISKGLLKQAKKIANKNIDTFKNLITKDTPLIGIEPSAIYTFKDEIPKFASQKQEALDIAKHTFLIEEFIQQEIQQGNIKSSQFTKAKKTILFHGHCYQKSLGNQSASTDLLNLPENYNARIISSGCCGMAGSFGYEKEHYEISMTIGNQVLFPAVKNTSEDTTIAANGNSCRHQITQGTKRQSFHPISILKQALIT